MNTITPATTPRIKPLIPHPIRRVFPPLIAGVGVEIGADFDGTGAEVPMLNKVLLGNGILVRVEDAAVAFEKE
jgi:hypothetical protein